MEDFRLPAPLVGLLKLSKLKWVPNSTFVTRPTRWTWNLMEESYSSCSKKKSTTSKSTLAKTNPPTSKPTTKSTPQAAPKPVSPKATPKPARLLPATPTPSPKTNVPQTPPKPTSPCQPAPPMQTTPPRSPALPSVHSRPVEEGEPWYACYAPNVIYRVNIHNAFMAKGHIPKKICETPVGQIAFEYYVSMRLGRDTQCAELHKNQNSKFHFSDAHS